MNRTVENELSLNAFLSESMVRQGEKPAIRFLQKGREYELSFLKLYEKSQALAGWMTQNIRPHTPIGILGDNCAEWLIVFFAALFSGNTAVLLDKTARGEALTTEAELSGASVFFIEEAYRELLDDAATHADIYLFEDISDYMETEEKPLPETDDEAPAIVFFSSGTTGRQKAIMLCRRQLAARFAINRGSWPFPEENLLVLPLYHAYGMNVTSATLLQGKCLYLSKSQKYFLRDIKARKPVMRSMVPSQAEMLLDDLEKEGEKSSLTHIMLASARVDESLKLRMRSHGITHIAHYGSSESCMVSVGEEREIASGFAGRILEGNEIQLRDSDASGDGEIFIRTPGRFSAYLKDDEETAKVLSGDWIRTGDIGRIDADGRLFITGRVKNVIVLPNGEKISPELLEERLLALPGVLECMVYAKNGRLTAELYTKENERDGISSGIRKINEGLSLYKQITETVFRDEPFEKTTLGKKKR